MRRRKRLSKMDRDSLWNVPLSRNDLDTILLGLGFAKNAVANADGDALAVQALTDHVRRCAAAQDRRLRWRPYRTRLVVRDELRL